MTYRILIAVLMVAACGKGGASKDDGKVASCNMPSLQSCREYRGGNLALGTEGLAKLCAIGNFTLTETACPTTDIIGVCAENEHTDFIYKDYPSAADKFEADCKTKGGKFRSK